MDALKSQVQDEKMAREEQRLNRALTLNSTRPRSFSAGAPPTTWNRTNTDIKTLRREDFLMFKEQIATDTKETEKK